MCVRVYVCVCVCMYVCMCVCKEWTHGGVRAWESMVAVYTPDMHKYAHRNYIRGCNFYPGAVTHPCGHHRLRAFNLCHKKFRDVKPDAHFSLPATTRTRAAAVLCGRTITHVWTSTPLSLRTHIHIHIHTHAHIHTHTRAIAMSGGEVNPDL